MTVTFNSGHSARSRAGRPERKPRHRPAGGEMLHDDAVETPAVKTFAQLGLPEPLLRALAEAGIDAPFPIQSATIPDALAGRDVLGRAQTGSGKTLAFGLAMLARLDGGKARPKRPRALVLVPTRELAMQVADSLTPLAKALGLWCRTAVGGMSFARQADALARGVDLLIATPGRLSDHVRQGTASLGDCNFIALDEADQMADMGFMPQVREIMDLTPPGGQRLLFSATLDGDVDKLVRQYLADPVTHSVAPSTASVTTMDHHLFQVSHSDKQEVVTRIGAREGRTIMFVRTKHHVDRLTERLRERGVHAAALHGGKTQGQRNRVLADFKEGYSAVLVATDVAARGIHVDDISLVLHVDPAADHKDYLHRAGRTARAGASGTVVTLVTHDQRRTVRRMTDRAGVRAETTMVRPDDTELSRITGAREPSGEPVVERRREAPRRSGGRGFGGSGGSGSGGFGGDRRDRGYRGSREGGYSRDGGSREGGYRSRDGGGYRGSRDNGSRDGGYSRDGGSRDGGYSRDSGPREGGYSRDGGARDGGYSRDSGSREGGYSRDGGYRGSRDGGGYGRGRQQQRFGGSGRPQRPSRGPRRGHDA
ncbi:DEAD/DEAH box helicase [Amycolatopsis jejuensis]|uniref:DEAD/DEAH box helicase n=1 Tax=Amycolatopsis jejuensis TaxID=330084 RepID=UPI000527AA51|nr:DEAD/DEAH box helicase [Amycolatopsis jejuensis]